jgi:hypothetical protein
LAEISFIFQSVADLRIVLHIPYGASFPKVDKTSDSYQFWPRLSGLNQASDLGRYAELKSKDIHTVRAQCRSGKLPAYREGKRWRIDQEFLNRAIAREASLRYFRRYFGDGDGKHPLTARDKRVLEYTLVKMDLRDPEERRKYIFYRLCDPEERQKFLDAYAEISGPYADIMTAADWLKLTNGSLPTVEELAKHLRTSKSALYRRLPQIMQVLRQRYHIDDLPDGVASQIGGSPWGVRVAGAVDFDYDAIDDI